MANKKKKPGAFRLHMKPEEITPPDFKSGEPASLGPQTSQCGRRAYISYQPGTMACFNCGLYHEPTEEQRALVQKILAERENAQTKEAD